MADMPLTPQTEEAQQRIMLEQHNKDVQDLIEVGRTHYGTATFDEASAQVADALGPRVKEFLPILKQFDRPHEIVAHLANNEPQLKALAKLSPARQIVELGRIEAQMTSNGHVNTGSEPLWKNPSVRSGRVSDENWSRTYGEGLSEKQFTKEFERRQAERYARERK